jgi:hypothetical protein
VRWELHRVWEVEGKPKAGVRHLYSKRVMYFDEDTAGAGVSDSYDSAGSIYRVNMVFPYPFYEGDAIMGDHFATFDLSTGAYNDSVTAVETGGYRMVPRQPATYWTPDSMAAAGVR